MKTKTVMKNTQTRMNTPMKPRLRLGNSVDMKGGEKKKVEELKPEGEETLEQTLSRLKAVKTPMKKY